MSLDAGQVIDGKYRIVRLIGTGGMGAVYEGENVLIRRRVAIKVLHAGTAKSDDLIRRFEREAQAAGEIGNDHILEVLDVGSLPNGDRYMVMEYLDGETLATRIDRHGRLTPGQIAPLARQFLTALASAHEAGIIHRDLKPENIFILRAKAGRADFVKLIDFGISKFSRRASEGGHKTTHHGALLGTPCYMSPEQARGKSEADVRSDIYSCGVILFEAVTGKLPFEAETFNDLMFKIALSDAPSPLSILPSLDPEFAWLITRAMARDPAQRFQTVQAFAEALDEWMRKNALTATLAKPPPVDAFPSASSPRISISEEPTQPRRSSPNDVTVAESLDAEVDSLQFQKTGTAESWAHSNAVPAKRSRRALLAAASGAALLVIAVGIAVLSRGPAPSPASAAEGTPSAAPSSATNARPPKAGLDDEPLSLDVPARPPPSASAPKSTPPAATSAPRVGNNARPAPTTKPKPAASRRVIDLGY